MARDPGDLTNWIFVALDSAASAARMFGAHAADVPRTSLDVLLRQKSGHLVVTPEAGLGPEAFHAFLAALAGCAKSPVVLDLTHVLPTDDTLRAVYDALHGSASRAQTVRVVAMRPTARRRIRRFLGDRGVSVYPCVDSAIGE